MIGNLYEWQEEKGIIKPLPLMENREEQAGAELSQALASIIKLESLLKVDLTLNVF